MTSAMSNKFFRTFIFVLALAPVSFAATMPDEYAPFLNPPPGDAYPSPVIEAGQAIFGRIFGVQGSGAEIEHHVFDLSNRTPTHAAVRSALVPGWGQVFNRDRIKGILFFVTTTASAVGSVLLYNDSRDSYDDYKAQGLKDSSLYDDYEDKRTQAMVLGVAAVVFYTVGIVDAYKKAYQPLYSTKSSVNLALSPTESQIIWERRF